MYLDFTDEKYKQLALSKKIVNYENNVTAKDAFIALLKGLDYELMDNLCVDVANKLTMDDPQKIYKLVQSNQCDDNLKNLILYTAYEIVHSKRFIGSKKRNGRPLTSWVSHCLYEGELASQFATKMGLNPDVAMKLGIVHDIGRKFDHSFCHTIKGFEFLVDEGLIDEAFCTLSHSFLTEEKNGVYKGNRNAICDPPLEGFYVDSNGNGLIKEGTKKDDITDFLENYEYNTYDVVINIADLMAMTVGIVSPYERLIDIYTRKKPDPKNSAYFKVCFINNLNRIMYQITNNEEYSKPINLNDMKSESEINEMLIKTSANFMLMYQRQIIQEKGMSL